MKAPVASSRSAAAPTPVPAARSPRLAAALLLASFAGFGCTKQQVPIFLWHAVGEGDGDRYDLPAEELDAQLSLIEQYGATPITLGRLFDGTELPARPVVLTFDDGRRCLYDVALPLLQRHHMVADAFIVTGWTKSLDAERHWFSDETGSHPTLLWSELEQMQRSGVFELGSHSHTHPRFAELSAAQQKAELEQSRQLLAEHLPGAGDFFAWPYGSLGSGSKALAEAAGYRGAVTVAQHGGGRYGLERVSVWAGSTQVVRAALTAAYGAR